MIRRPPISTRTDTLFPYTTLFRSKNKGGWRAIVAIADVSFYVRPDGALDREARRRGNSVYFPDRVVRSEEHTSELRSLMRSSYAVFCLKKKKDNETSCTIARLINYICLKQ